MKEIIKRTILYVSMAAMVGMMYPKYCFADGTYRIIIEESGKKIEIPCEDEDYYAIFSADTNQIVVKSRVVEWIEEWRKLCL